MLGGTTLLDEHGRILWVERPFHHPPGFYVGKSTWDFTAPGAVTKEAQEAFAWTLAMGGRTERRGASGNAIPGAAWRYDFERLLVSHCIIVHRFAPLSEVHLTPTEERVAAMLVRDMRGDEIVQALNVTESTVQTHRRSILSKVGVRGIAGLTRWYEERKRWIV